MVAEIFYPPLGFGNAATKDVGTTPGTVAAGDAVVAAQAAAVAAAALDATSKAAAAQAAAIAAAAADATAKTVGKANTSDLLGVAQDTLTALAGKLDTNGDGKAVTLTETSTGAIAASLLDRAMMQPVYAVLYGVVADGVTDDAPAIRRALAAAKARAVSVVILPARTCAIASTLNLPDWSNVQLIGAGRGAVPGAVPNTQSGAQDATVLKWIGASGGVMVDTQSPSANRPYLTAGMQIRGIVLDGNGLAGTALYSRGLVNSHIEIKFRNVTSIGYDLDIYTGGGADVQGNTFDIQGDLDYNASTTANGLVIGPGTSYNNVHHNWFRCVRIITRNGTGWVIGNADSNTATNVQINYPYQPGGNIYTGIGMDLRAAPNALGPGGVTQAARSNVFFGVSCIAPTYVRAGSFGLPSYGNVIQGFIQDSGEPNPVIETGASLDWVSAIGGWHIKSFYPGQQIWKSPGDYEVLFQNQSGATVGYIGTDGIFNGIPTDGLRIRNDKGGGIGAGNSAGIFWDTSNNISFPSIRSFASNSAAATAGLPVGVLYYNTSSGSLALRQ